VGMKTLVCLALVACSGGKSRAIEDAKHPPPPGDANVRRDAAPAATPTTGDVQIRIEWTNVPAAIRTSPGATPCNTPRAPSVSPSTTWGIGDVFVIVDGAPTGHGEARVRLADCVLAPRVLIGDSLAIESAADRPAKLVLARRGDVASLDHLETGTRRTIQLPIAGHTVTTALEPNGVYELATDAKDPETAWILAAPAAITEPNGVVLVKDVPVGKHAVRAWLPPRAGQPARHATGEVTVAGGDLAELTLQLVP
jgi:hypothetical protein